MNDNMKNRFFKSAFNISVLLTSLLALQACDNFLSENPDNRVEINSTEKAAQLLTSAYSGAAYTFTEWMSDNVTYTTGTFILPEHTQSYQWEDITSVNQDTPANFWASGYQAIAHANQVLAVIDNLPGERDQKKAVEGEALLTRAYGHFMLVNLFAKHYDEETAGSDPGIPYVKEPETTFIKKYTRLSVEEVYDEIEDDLQRGLDLVDASFYANSGKYHFTPNAALAFASRFYLFKGDLDKCIEYSSEMLGNAPEIYLKDLDKLLTETTSTEEYLRAYTSPNDPSNLLLIRQVTNFHVNVGYWPSSDMIYSIYGNNPWDSRDRRGPNATNVTPIFIRGSGSGNWLSLAKFDFLFERSSLTSNVGLNYTIMPVFRGDEVLLNRAECYARKNQIDLALADLQTFVNMKYEGTISVTSTAIRNAYGTTNTQLAVFVYIIDERQKEFLHEGLRWFDIKRLGFDVTHVTPTGTIVLSSDDNRKVLQIPQAAIDVAGLEPNPR